MKEIALHKEDLDAIIAFVSKYPSSADWVTISVDSSSGIGSIVKASIQTAHEGDFVQITKTITDQTSW